MGMTISTHNGTAAHREHNIRLASVISKQEHIDKDGKYEIWHDEAPRKAYERIFGEYVQEYNAKQKRPERRIKDYYKDIQNDSKRNAVYEMIVAVGNKDNAPAEQTCRTILHEFVYGNEDIGFRSWQERNPQFELIGAYYHADEEGVPHLHVDYVPVAEGYQRGMAVQNGLDRALRQMGYEHKGNHATPQIQWEKAENGRLEQLCQWHGLEIDHPQLGKGVEHVHTELYKAKAEYNTAVSELKADLGDLEEQKSIYEDSLEVMQDVHIELQNDTFKLQHEHDTLENRVLDLKGQLSELSQLRADLKLEVEELNQQILEKSSIIKEFNEFKEKFKSVVEQMPEMKKLNRFISIFQQFHDSIKNNNEWNSSRIDEWKDMNSNLDRSGLRPQMPEDLLESPKARMQREQMKYDVAHEQERKEKFKLKIKDNEEEQ